MGRSMTRKGNGYGSRLELDMEAIKRTPIHEALEPARDAVALDGEVGPAIVAGTVIGQIEATKERDVDVMVCINNLH